MFLLFGNNFEIAAEYKRDYKILIEKTKNLSLTPEKEIVIKNIENLENLRKLEEIFMLKDNVGKLYFNTTFEQENLIKISELSKLLKTDCELDCRYIFEKEECDVEEESNTKVLYMVKEVLKFIYNYEFYGHKGNLCEKIPEILTISKKLEKESENNNDLTRAEANCIKILNYELKEHLRIIKNSYINDEKIQKSLEEEQSLLELKIDIIKFILKENVQLNEGYFLSTPLRIAIFYYINLIKEVLECMTILNLKTKKEFSNEVLGNSKTAEIIGNGYLRGHRVINFTFIEKIILRYKNELPENKIKNLYRFLFLHDSIMAFIQENYSYEKIIYFNQEYIKNLFSQGSNISDMKPQNIKKEKYVTYEKDIYSFFYEEYTSIDVKTSAQEQLKEGSCYAVKINSYKKFKSEFSEDETLQEKDMRAIRRLEKWCNDDLDYLNIPEINSKVLIFKLLEEKKFVINNVEKKYLCIEFLERYIKRNGNNEYDGTQIRELYLRREQVDILGEIKKIEISFN